jgi:hypothetical protein
MLNGAGLDTARWFGASVRIAVSCSFHNSGTRNGVLSRRNAFPAMVCGMGRHAHA